MESESEKAFVVHNISSKRTETVQLPEAAADMTIVYMANPGAEVKDGKLTVPPMTSVVLAKNK